VLSRFPALEVGKDLHIADEAGRTGSDVVDNSWIGLLGMLRLKRQLMIRGAANPLRIWKSFGEIRLREPKEFFVANFPSFLVAHRFALPASIRKAADCTSFSRLYPLAYFKS
jgi:hypothetical protein